MPMPSTTNTSSDSDTAPITREPAFATVRTSALKPSAAIAMIVRFVDTTRVGATQLDGTAPPARNAASTRNPTMNQGTSFVSDGARPNPLPERSAKNSTTGPSINTRTSFTSVATSPDRTLTGNAAASTCGTAYTVRRVHELPSRARASQPIDL